MVSRVNTKSGSHKPGEVKFQKKECRPAFLRRGKTDTLTDLRDVMACGPGNESGGYRQMNALTLIIVSLCALAIAYRLHGLFVANKVLALRVPSADTAVEKWG